MKATKVLGRVVVLVLIASILCSCIPDSTVPADPDRSFIAIPESDQPAPVNPNPSADTTDSTVHTPIAEPKPVPVTFRDIPDASKWVTAEFAMISIIAALSNTYGFDNIPVENIEDPTIEIQGEKITYNEYVRDVLSGTVIPENFPVVLPMGSCEAGEPPDKAQQVYEEMFRLMKAEYGANALDHVFVSRFGDPFGMVLRVIILGGDRTTRPGLVIGGEHLTYPQALKILRRCNRFRVSFEEDGVHVYEQSQDVEAQGMRIIIYTAAAVGIVAIAPETLPTWPVIYVLKPSFATP